MDNSIREQIIRHLASGEFASGQYLGELFGISRAAVSKHIKAISLMGLDVFRVTGKGYKLSAPINLLNNQTIESYLFERAVRIPLEVFSLVDSTNSLLMRRLSTDLEQGQVCVAEYQSAGRGRRGRQWISPFGSNIYLSMHWRFEQGMSAAMGLNIVTALAISDAIKSLFDIDVQLKWPNDIYLSGVKLAGILIDLEGQALEPCHCVIGIGLNLKMPAESASLIDQPWTMLSQHTKQEIDRNLLVATIIEHLYKRLEKHEKNENQSIVDEWQKQDYFSGKAVKLISGEREVKGICRGIDQQGALMLEIDGVVKAMYGGELSLRAQ